MATSSVKIKKEYEDVKSCFKSEHQDRNLATIPMAPPCVPLSGPDDAKPKFQHDQQPTGQHVERSRNAGRRRGPGFVLIRQDQGTIRAHYSRVAQRLQLSLSGKKVELNSQWINRVLQRLSQVKIELEIPQGEHERALAQLPGFGKTHFKRDFNIYLTNAYDIKIFYKAQERFPDTRIKSQEVAAVKKEEPASVDSKPRTDSDNGKSKDLVKIGSENISPGAALCSFN